MMKRWKLIYLYACLSWPWVALQFSVVTFGWSWIVWTWLDMSMCFITGNVTKLPSSAKSTSLCSFSYHSSLVARGTWDFSSFQICWHSKIVFIFLRHPINLELLVAVLCTIYTIYWGINLVRVKEDIIFQSWLKLSVRQNSMNFHFFCSPHSTFRWWWKSVVTSTTNALFYLWAVDLLPYSYLHGFLDGIIINITLVCSDLMSLLAN